MRERFLDATAWKRTMDGWRLAINGHTVDLIEGPPGFFTPIVDWLTNLTAFPGASCADLRAAVGYAWPVVASTLQAEQAAMRSAAKRPGSPQVSRG